MKDSIIDKVKKLLAKAGSTDSTQEAESLFTAAQKLMVKHRIQQSELIDADQQEIRADQVTCFEFRLEGDLENRLANVIGRANAVVPVYSKHGKRITFYGPAQDVQLVKFLFETTRDTFRRLSKSEYRKLNKEGQVSVGKNVFIRSFLIGACDGLNSKIHRMTQEYTQEVNLTDSYALVLRTQVEKVHQHIKENLSTTTRKTNITPGDKSAYDSGVQTGKNHSMHIPVETTSSGSNKVNRLN